MKKHFAALLVAITMVMAGGCTDDNNPGTTNPEPVNSIDVVNTSWRGTCHSTYNHSQYGDLPADLTVTMDFSEEKVEFYLELSVGGQSQSGRSGEAQYSYKDNEGYLIDSDNPTNQTPFTIDAINRTLTTEVHVMVGESEENASLVGGRVVLNQIN